MLAPSFNINQELERVLPLLMPSAMRFVRDVTRAEDLVQDTVMRALVFQDYFTPGTDFTAWIMVIMRHLFFSQVKRRKKHEAEDPDDQLANTTLVQDGAQEATVDLKRVLARAAKMNPKLRDVWLRSIVGLSYHEIAIDLDLPLGTVRSRVSRARDRVASLLKV